MYAVMDEAERRHLMESLIDEIQIYEERQPNGARKMRSRRTMLRLALTPRINTGSGAQRKTFDRLLKFYCSDIIDMTDRCRVTCVSIYTERERT